MSQSADRNKRRGVSQLAEQLAAFGLRTAR